MTFVIVLPETTAWHMNINTNQLYNLTALYQLHTNNLGHKFRKLCIWKI